MTLVRKVAPVVLLIVVLLVAVLRVVGNRAFSPPRHGAQQLNPVQLENLHTGSANWVPTKPALDGEIQAYVGADSVNQGESVPVYVSVKTAGDTYTMDLYRLGYYQGTGGRLISSQAGLVGLAQGYYAKTENSSDPINCRTCLVSGASTLDTPPNRQAGLIDPLGHPTYLTDANWTRTSTIATANLVSGLYVLKFTEAAGDYQWLVAFVVREDGRSADLVLEYPMNTDVAYNIWGGADAYRNYRLYPSTGTGAAPYWTFYDSFDRPITMDGGTDGVGNVFQTAESMVYFLEQQGFDVTYTTNNAVLEGKTALLHYKGFLSVAHDEYVNHAERQELEQAEANGVSLGFFGGNDLYWQTRNLPDGAGRPDRIMVEYKNYSAPNHDPYVLPNSGYYNPAEVSTLYRAAPVNNPEDKLLKAMYPIGAGGSQYAAFVATNTASWVFHNSGLHDGDTIQGIVGQEVESVFPNDGSITPADHITIIGTSPFLASNGTTYTANAVLDELQNGKGNISFDAGTISWAGGLAHTPAAGVWYTSPPVSTPLQVITGNILWRMVTGSTTGRPGGEGAPPTPASSVTPSPIQASPAASPFE
jgi:hypothetical protein